jgi:hypothetical protein
LLPALVSQGLHISLPSQHLLPLPPLPLPPPPTLPSPHAPRAPPSPHPTPSPPLPHHPPRFSWITFKTPAAAEAALNKNGQHLEGFDIRVEVHRPKEPRAPAAPRGAAGAGAPREALPRVGNPCRVFVGDLPAEFDRDALAALFEKYGKVEGTKLNPPRRCVRGPAPWLSVCCCAVVLLCCCAVVLLCVCVCACECE